jgi:7-carboxy-7-deazaguanine synthase
MLQVSEIFHSIQGESSFAGFPCVFIRLAGCNLQCSYCDTGYSREGGTPMSVPAALERIESYGCGLVEITGGEPMLQEETPELAGALLRSGHSVLVETNGSVDIRGLPEGAVRIMDIKCPASGMSRNNRWENIAALRAADEVKFVVSDEPDYRWMTGVIQERLSGSRASIAVTPAHGRINPALLAEWMLRDRLAIRLQLQVHKILWPFEERGR